MSAPTSSKLAPGPISPDDSVDGIYWEERIVKEIPTWTRVKQCPDCSKVIALGPGRGENALQKHRNGSNCTASSNITKAKPSVGGKVKKTAPDPKQRALTSMFAPKPREAPAHLPPASTSVSNDMADIETPSGIPDLPPPTPSQPASPLPSGLIDLTSPDLSDDNDSLHGDNTSHPDPETHFPLPSDLQKKLDDGLCPSIRLPLPGSAYTSYPWQLHAKENLPYVIECVTPDGQRYVRSKRCDGVRRSNQRPCFPCSDLISHRDVEALIKRAGTITQDELILLKLAPQEQSERRAGKRKARVVVEDSDIENDEVVAECPRPQPRPKKKAKTT